MREGRNEMKSNYGWSFGSVGEEMSCAIAPLQLVGQDKLVDIG